MLVDQIFKKPLFDICGQQKNKKKTISKYRLDGGDIRYWYVHFTFST